VTDRQDVSIDPAARTLTFTPAAGDARVETIYLTVVRPGEPPTRVAVLVDVSSQPASSSGLVFGLALLVAGGIVGLTLMRIHQGRSRDEAIFRIEGKPPSKKALREEGSAPKAGGATTPPGDPPKGAPPPAAREDE